MGTSSRRVAVLAECMIERLAAGSQHCGAIIPHEAMAHAVPSPPS